jgi:hypothetical protein
MVSELVCFDRILRLIIRLVQNKLLGKKSKVSARQTQVLESAMVSAYLCQTGIAKNRENKRRKKCSFDFVKLTIAALQRIMY